MSFLIPFFSLFFAVLKKSLCSSINHYFYPINQSIHQSINQAIILMVPKLLKKPFPNCSVHSHAVIQRSMEKRFDVNTAKHSGLNSWQFKPISIRRWACWLKSLLPFSWEVLSLVCYYFCKNILKGNFWPM